MPRMLPDGRRLGAHLPLGRGMVKAVDRAHEIGADALQVFADNPTAWRRRAAPPAEGPAFRERLIELDIRPVAIHASYLVNLAGPEEDFFGRSVGVLASDLRAAPWFAARYVNVHVGSHRGAGVPAGIARLADGLALVTAEVDRTPDGPMIVLENGAGSGFGLGTNVTELAGIAEACLAHGIDRDRLGFCLDAAHAWAAGIDLSDPARDRPVPGRLRWPHRPRSAGHDPPQQFEVGAWLTGRSTRASRGRRDRRRRLASPACPSVAGARHVLPRDARDGRGLRRDQCRARP